MKNKVYIICAILIILIVLFIIGTKFGEKIAERGLKPNKRPPAYLQSGDLFASQKMVYVCFAGRGDYTRPIALAMSRLTPRTLTVSSPKIPSSFPSVLFSTICSSSSWLRPEAAARAGI